MDILTAMRERVDALATVPAVGVEPSDLAASIRSLGGDGALAVIRDASAIRDAAERLIAVASGVVAELSHRDRGDGGFSATRGHRSPVSLVQEVTGGTRAEAVRAVRLGTSLVDVATDASVASEAPGSEGAGAADAHSALPQEPWHHRLRAAMLEGTITPAQHHAILRGLGEPPITDAGDATAADTVGQVWAVAADQLITEAPQCTVEDLARRGRQMRDILDPAGAQERFWARFEKRAFRTWVDDDGVRHARIVFDDEMGAWVTSILDAALRPRRGGPRFVDAAERHAADELVEDPRTNEQIAYDLLMDVLRAGALADARDVFGARQPGVRMLVVKDIVGPRDALGRLLAVGHVEDGGDTLPGPVIDRALCATGSVDVTVDACGNPLDVGREQRLFTPRQRIALAARDGGCRMPGCSVPASYCEAHHCEHWSEHGGRTDIDDGILLCRWHHMALHHQGWRITRDGKGAFVLHRPAITGAAAPIPLPSKAPWRWAWDAPPPVRESWRSTRPPGRAA